MLVRGWFVVCSAVAVLAACGEATPDDPHQSDSDDPIGLNTGPGPSVLAVSPAVAPGGLLYLSSDEAMSRIDVDLDGVPLVLERALQTEVPWGLFRVPERAPASVAELAVRRRDDEAGRATALDLAVVEPVFRDVAARAGVALVHDVEGSPRECAHSHTGVAFGDYDDDGGPDMFVGNVGSGGQLHRNLGDDDDDGVPDFADVTDDVGLSGVDAVAMAMFVDLEGDGDLDLFVGRRGANRVFENRLVPDGAARFVDVTDALGLGHEDQRTMGVAFGDYDGDDDLDLYVVNHAYCFPEPGSEIRAEDHLYRNDGGVFVERSDLLGGLVMTSVGFSAAWVDVDRDRDQDLVVINDDVGGIIGFPNALWRNDGPGAADGDWVFTDVSEASGMALRGVNGMGLGLGDVNGDGFVDLAFSNIGANRLLLNATDGTFVDASHDAGIERGRLPWGEASTTWATHLFDYDNDGDLDLYFSGGPIKGPAVVPDALLENVGDGRFEEVTWWSGVADMGSAKAAALVDLERDGTWDMATTSWNGAFRLYQNRTRAARDNHWLDVELQGRGGNREAVGAIVEIEVAGRTDTCFHTSRPSLGAGGDTHCHFGLGGADRIDALRIVWPDGSTEAVDPPAVDRRIRYVQAAR
jgi:hypothetical protein